MIVFKNVRHYHQWPKYPKVRRQCQACLKIVSRVFFVARLEQRLPANKEPVQEHCVLDNAYGFIIILGFGVTCNPIISEEMLHLYFLNIPLKALITWVFNKYDYILYILDN